MTMFDLTGLAAVVTGGNGGIGLGMARGLAEAGASVVVAARKAEKAAAALAALGDRSIFIALDVTDETSCRAMIEQTSDRLGRLDILVNNAGTSIRKPPEAYTAAEWHAVLDTNPVFAGRSSGHETKRRRQDHQHRQHVRVVRIRLRRPLCREQGCPRPADEVTGRSLGGGQHPGQRGLARLDRHRADRDARQQVAGLHERVLARTPAGRWGVPGDLAGIAVFLASAASDFITGAAIPVDGGFSAMG